MKFSKVFLLLSIAFIYNSSAYNNTASKNKKTFHNESIYISRYQPQPQSPNLSYNSKKQQEQFYNYNKHKKKQSNK